MHKDLPDRDMDQIGGGAEVVEAQVEVEVAGTGSHELLQPGSHRAVCYDTHFPCLEDACLVMAVFWHNHLEGMGMELAPA
jgi:hypothetical protein